VIVGTWNLENLFRPGADAGPSDEQAYDAKLTELARVIGQIGPDILAVQEVGDPEALEDLRDRLEGDWVAQSSELPDGRGIRVGFLSQLALGNVEQVSEFPDGLAPVQVDDEGTTMAEMGRGGLRVRVETGGRNVDLVSCHLKSKLLTFPGGRHNPRNEGERARFAGYALYRRAAEAVTLRAFANELLDGQGRERAVIVLGDLNDEPAAATTQILLGPPGSEIDTPGFERPDQGDGSRLWNLAPLISEERRFSRVFRGRGELIDHILVSHALVQRVEQVDTGPGEPPSITEDPAERRDEPASDHLPVVARFSLG
jgi:endonuclease/exonuclease/phosphatase family metal-dependent hydrolase